MHAPQTCFAVDWETYLSETALDFFISNGYLLLDDVFSQLDLMALQTESGFIDYREATLTYGQRISHIRGDKIRWIDKNSPSGMAYLQAIDDLAHFFNRYLFAGIRHCEAHYACYPSGFGYQWHTDNPQGRDERVISAVFYLNDEWQKSDGGALEMIDKHGHSHEVLPKANRLIIFDSNLRHQVQIAHRQRYSIATWMRRDNPVPFVAD
ncbi:2OG-Fe(II) oxygenase [Psychrobacter sp. I-STPA6b]|uniref:2OG-Fe(II) oxygenase n=1 Tax=Psychrobacter sp. I-STPA6b TaxID=2585718 RepID=UPI001D0C996A|nr:2OG-Fe(II) oxygenase [Psychrobacter sp. I-STPA6b]